MTESERRNVELRCAFCGKRNRLDMTRAADRPRCGECEKPFLLDRPVKVASEDLQTVVAGADVPVLVDFYADWCGPCKVMAPVLDELAAERIGSVLVAKLDTDRSCSACTGRAARLTLRRACRRRPRQPGLP